MNISKIALYTDPDEPLTLTPTESIVSMFDHTDENGVLYIPEWPYGSWSDGKERFYRCDMNWTREDLAEALSRYEYCFNTIQKISATFDPDSSAFDTGSLSGDEKKFWNAYIRGFETGGIDEVLVMDIADRMETVDMVSSTAEKIGSGIDVPKEDLEFYNEYRDTAVSEDEKALYESYRAAVRTDSERRVGENIAAYDTVIRAMRLCRLLALGAPEIIVNNEAGLFAQALVIHTYCNGMRTVETV